MPDLRVGDTDAPIFIINLEKLNVMGLIGPHSRRSQVAAVLNCQKQGEHMYIISSTDKVAFMMV